MSISLIKVLSCAIFIAKKNNNKILTILLKDYARETVSKTHFMFIILLVGCYEEKNIFENSSFYKLLDIYIKINGNKLCKKLIHL